MEVGVYIYNFYCRVGYRVKEELEVVFISVDTTKRQDNKSGSGGVRSFLSVWLTEVIKKVKK